MESLIATWFDRVWKNKDEEAIDELFHEEGTAYGLTEAGNLYTREKFKQFYETYREQINSLEVDVEKELTRDEFEAALCTVTVKRADKVVCFPAIAMIEKKDGKIYKAWNHFDELAEFLFNKNELQPAAESMKDLMLHR